jgi:hypothetical protein
MTILSNSLKNNFRAAAGCRFFLDETQTGKGSDKKAGTDFPFRLLL